MCKNEPFFDIHTLLETEINVLACIKSVCVCYYNTCFNEVDVTNNILINFVVFEIYRFLCVSVNYFQFAHSAQVFF